MEILNSALGNKEQREGSFAAPVACLMCISLFTCMHACAYISMHVQQHNAQASINMHNVHVCTNRHVCNMNVHVNTYVMLVSVLTCMGDVHVGFNHM